MTSTNTLEQLKADSDHAFDLSLQKQNLLEHCRARQIMAYNDGLFMVDHNHIAFLQAMKDMGLQRACMLDSNNNPIEVEVKDLMEKSVARYHEALYAYHQLYETLKKNKK